MRHMIIQYLLISDGVRRGEVKKRNLPSERMVADYLTKTIQGACSDGSIR